MYSLSLSGAKFHSKGISVTHEEVTMTLRTEGVLDAASRTTVTIFTAGSMIAPS